jgi:archaellum biogenesis protein FlaJ (TadC family)
MVNSDNSQDRPSRVTRRETWVYRLGLLSVAVYTALGVYLLYYPSDALTTVFVILLIVTLGLGLLAGIVAVYSD